MIAWVNLANHAITCCLTGAQLIKDADLRKLVPTILVVVSILYAPFAWAQVISQTGWMLVSVDSQETVKGAHDGAKAFDGNASTIWHTRWSGIEPDPPPPHEIRINLGVVYDISGFRYLPRQDGITNGRIGQYEFYVSSDGVNWGSAVAIGTFANDMLEKEVSFVPKTGQYVRLRALTEVSGQPYTSMAELNVLVSLFDPHHHQRCPQQRTDSRRAVGRGHHRDQLERRHLCDLRRHSGHHHQQHRHHDHRDQPALGPDVTCRGEDGVNGLVGDEFHVSGRTSERAATGRLQTMRRKRKCFLLPSLVSCTVALTGNNPHHHQRCPQQRADSRRADGRGHHRDQLKRRHLSDLRRHSGHHHQQHRHHDHRDHAGPCGGSGQCRGDGERRDGDLHGRLHLRCIS